MDRPILLIAAIFLLLVIAIIGATKKGRHKRNIKKSRTILKKIRSFENDGSIINYLRKIDPFVFEELLLEAFQEKGFQIKRNKRYTGDGGIDGRVFYKGKSYLVQAKRYSSYVNPEHIKEFEIIVNEKNVGGGFFVHTGKTGKGTKKSYRIGKIEIISGNRLIELLKAV